jgi:DNA-directed RNA polymerase subunit RPC12/RpoP
MTEIARHLRCDSRQVCSQCSIYLWKPSIEQRYYQFCPVCSNDILCDRGIIQEFIYDNEQQAKRVKYLCLICRTEVEDKVWPKPTGMQLDMVR